MDNTYNLKRFLDAQDKGYHIALTEIKTGQKRSHWMWYIFPQVAGLGFSEMSKFFAIRNLPEAKAFLDHPLLGSRIIEISSALINLPGKNATAILGTPEDLKLHSSMTLFASVPGANSVFAAVLKKYFDGNRDVATLQLYNLNKLA